MVPWVPSASFRLPALPLVKADLLMLTNSHWSTILVPLRIPPTSDGRKWTKRQGWEADQLDASEELTDEEEMSDGEQ